MRQRSHHDHDRREVRRVRTRTSCALPPVGHHRRTRTRWTVLLATARALSRGAAHAGGRGEGVVAGTGTGSRPRSRRTRPGRAGTLPPSVAARPRPARPRSARSSRRRTRLSRRTRRWGGTRRPIGRSPEVGRARCGPHVARGGCCPLRWTLLWRSRLVGNRLRCRPVDCLVGSASGWFASLVEGCRCWRRSLLRRVGLLLRRRSSRLLGSRLLLRLLLRSSLAVGLRRRRRLGRERFLEFAYDWRLDRRRRRTHEFTEFLQLGHDGLAFDAELFRELVDPDLCHCSPSPARAPSGPGR